MNPPRFDITKSFLWSLGSVVVIALVLLSTLPAFLGAVFTSSTSSMNVVSSLDKLIGEHEEAMVLYQARFNGREVFYTPPPTPKPPPPRIITKIPNRDIITKPEDKPKPRPTPPPANYTGPTILAILGDQVWFASSTFQSEIMRLRVGDEKNNLKVLATNPPWSARVSYQRGEYDVKLFDRDGIKFEELRAKDTLPEGMTMEPVTSESDTPSPATGDKEAGSSDKSDQEPASAEDPPKSGSKVAEKDHIDPASTGNKTSDDQSQSRDKTKETGSEKTSGGVTSDVGDSESDASRPHD